MDADRDDPDDYDRSGALLAAGSAARQEKQPGKGRAPAPAKTAVKGRQELSRDQVSDWSIRPMLTLSTHKVTQDLPYAPV